MKKLLLTLLALSFSFFCFSQDCTTVGKNVVNVLYDFKALTVIHEGEDLFIANMECDCQGLSIYSAKDIVNELLLNSNDCISISEEWQFSDECNCLRVMFMCSENGNRYDVGMSLVENSCKNVEIGILITKAKQ